MEAQRMVETAAARSDMTSPPKRQAWIQGSPRRRSRAALRQWRVALVPAAEPVHARIIDTIAP